MQDRGGSVLLSRHKSQQCCIESSERREKKIHIVNIACWLQLKYYACYEIRISNIQGGGGVHVRIRRFREGERVLAIPLELRNNIFSHVFDFCKV